MPADCRAIFFNHTSSIDTAGISGLAIQSNKADLDQLAAKGWDVVPEFNGGRYDIAFVQVHRSKAWTKEMIAQACGAADLVVVDGQKTDGIESHLKAVRKITPVIGSVTKAHGRMFWFKSVDLNDWKSAAFSPVAGFVTCAGIFSAEKADEGSVALCQALPDKLGPAVVDLGAGWGFLSKDILQRGSVNHLDCVEVDYRAAQCCEKNLNDPRVNVHWADATHWKGQYDDVVMNPPFHSGRDVSTALGKSFIGAAQRCLKKNGRLWMVANRHLPYEADLKASFREVEELPGTKGFKVLRACFPR